MPIAHETKQNYNCTNHDARRTTSEKKAKRMSRLEGHFRELGLDPASQHDGGAIKRAYHKVALRRHPDKGGSKEAFQKLSNAFETLMKEEPWKRSSAPSSPPPKRKKPEPQSDPRRASGNRDERQRSDWNDGYRYEHDDGDDDGDVWSESEDYFWEWQNWHYDFFRNGNFGHQDFEDFDARREMNVKERARQRAANVKSMGDYRDHQKTSNATSCTTCGEREGITEQDARCVRREF